VGEERTLVFVLNKYQKELIKQMKKHENPFINITKAMRRKSPRKAVKKWT
jgi:hypothetical protein